MSSCAYAWRVLAVRHSVLQANARALRMMHGARFGLLYLPQRRARRVTLRDSRVHNAIPRPMQGHMSHHHDNQDLKTPVYFRTRHSGGRTQGKTHHSTSNTLVATSRRIIWSKPAPYARTGRHTRPHTIHTTYVVLVVRAGNASMRQAPEQKLTAAFAGPHTCTPEALTGSGGLPSDLANDPTRTRGRPS